MTISEKGLCCKFFGVGLELVTDDVEVISSKERRSAPSSAVRSVRSRMPHPDAEDSPYALVTESLGTGVEAADMTRCPCAGPVPDRYRGSYGRVE
ncbi:putative hypothetical protein [Streptomyces sp. NBRC 110611]|uniref:hypothetical protein n=1 Tax=Streptomyces sp. NBRC 110611 TaxID=1621259 RepID=UPI000855584B|nr:hypothetical protein [Streptomyces sp. NBRC 110611]GAU66371.1 putative hypothetical protein [Streptomyces sp. NBRC 110611]